MAMILKNYGFDVLLCDFDEGAQVIGSHLNTVLDYNLLGVMHTTWYTLAQDTPKILMCVLEYWYTANEPMPKIHYNGYTAEVLRKVYFTDGDYTNSDRSEMETIS